MDRTCCLSMRNALLKVSKEERVKNIQVLRLLQAYWERNVGLRRRKGNIIRERYVQVLI